jgi:hypothetical protein
MGGGRKRGREEEDGRKGKGGGVHEKPSGRKVRMREEREGGKEGGRERGREGGKDKIKMPYLGDPQDGMGGIGGGSKGGHHSNDYGRPTCSDGKRMEGGMEGGRKGEKKGKKKPE